MSFPSGCLCKMCPNLSDCLALEKEVQEDSDFYVQLLKEEEAFRKELLS